MTRRSQILAVWTVVGGLVALCAALLWGPMRTAWTCYWLHENAAREQARVVGKLEAATFALLIEEGPHAGQACTADTSYAVWDATEEAQALEVVYVDWKPGTCELTSTLEASARLLWAIIGCLAGVCLLVFALGVGVHRSFTRPVDPRHRMAVDPQTVRCPSCGKCMDEGYAPLVAGVHWRRIGDPVGLPHALGGLPGTVGMRGRPRLHAFRCVPCEILTIQYGRSNER